MDYHISRRLCRGNCLAGLSEIVGVGDSPLAFDGPSGDPRGPCQLWLVMANHTRGSKATSLHNLAYYSTGHRAHPPKTAAPCLGISMDTVPVRPAANCRPGSRLFKSDYRAKEVDRGCFSNRRELKITI